MIALVPSVLAFELPRASWARGRGFAKGWTTATEEFVEPVPIAAPGHFPAWLNGVLIRNGPAMFEVGETRVHHQFDGFAKLNKFNFSGGAVHYQSRFLRSDVFNRTMRRGALLPHLPMLPTTPKFRYLERIRSLFASDPLDNNNINVHNTGRTLYATCDSSASSVFDVETLETLGVLDAAYARQISAAHPQSVVAGNDTINYVCDPSTLVLKLYRDCAATRTRTFIGRVQLDHAPLIHSFSVTEDYVVLFHYPLHMDVLRILSGASSLVESMRWARDRKVIAYVFDVHATRAQPPRARFALPAFFSMHCVNAFQSPDPSPGASRLTVDLIAYRDAAFVASADTYGQLDLMRDPSRLTGSNSHKMAPELRRVRMKLRGAPVRPSAPPARGAWIPSLEAWEATDRVACTMQRMPSAPFEMPSINRHRRGAPYDFVYGVTTTRMFQKWGITKTCLADAAASRQWTAPSNHFPTEPVFVARPSAEAGDEDDGVVLSVVLDAKREASYILCLDARTLAEVARAYLPVIIPFDVHGRWFEAT